MPILYAAQLKHISSFKLMHHAHGARPGGIGSMVKLKHSILRLCGNFELIGSIDISPRTLNHVKFTQTILLALLMQVLWKKTSI